VIASFGDQTTADLYHGRRSARARHVPADVAPGVVRKLDLVKAARQLRDRLEALRGDWKGFHSLRVNDQWRIVFQWSEGHAHEVQLIDYHLG
jgi:proteic killer suppression protein